MADALRKRVEEQFSILRSTVNTRYSGVEPSVIVAEVVVAVVTLWFVGFVIRKRQGKRKVCCRVVLTRALLRSLKKSTPKPSKFCLVVSRRFPLCRLCFNRVSFLECQLVNHRGQSL